MNTRNAFYFVLVSFVATGCATTSREPERRPVDPPAHPPTAPITLAPPAQKSRWPELEKYLRASGKSKEVRVPRSLLREFMMSQEQKAAECRVVEDQLKALKAVDTGRVSSASAK